jgi:hypothetical protein
VAFCLAARKYSGMLEKSLEALINYNDPIYQIENKEFNLALIKFGSFVSVIYNKRLSQTFILLQLLENEKLRNIFMEISEIPEFQILLLKFLDCYPALTKSKIIKAKITELFGKKKTRPNLNLKPVSDILRTANI